MILGWSSKYAGFLYSSCSTFTQAGVVGMATLSRAHLVGRGGAGSRGRGRSSVFTQVGGREQGSAGGMSMDRGSKLGEQLSMDVQAGGVGRGGAIRRCGLGVDPPA